jgi:ribose transport system permease protein
MPTAAEHGPSVADMTAQPAAQPDGALSRHRQRPGMARRMARALSPKNVSLLYIVGAFLILMAFWVPDLFYTSTTLKSLLYQQAVTGVVALAFLLPYTTLTFDLTVGAMVGVSSLVTCWLIVQQKVPVVLAILISIAFSSVIGSFTGSLVTYLKIDSIIATMAMMFIIDSLGGSANGGKQVLGLPNSYLKLSSFEVFGVSMPFFYLIALAAVLWFVLVHTPAGRYLYAAGGGKEAARLAGVDVKRMIFFTFIASAALAAIAGVMVSSRLGDGDFTVGDPYLFPAAAAIFLGATQVRPGVFNVWGTVIAVYSLGIIVKGLELAGAPFWLSNFMNGIALLAAVTVADLRVGKLGLRRRRRLAASPDASAASAH